MAHYELNMPVTEEQIRKLRDGVWGIKPRNREQHFALDLLLNDDIKLVTLVGKAGTGKTLLAIAAGLQKVTEEQVFSKLLVSRPIFPLGRDIGYLPGTIEEKLNPWMQPIYDNLELLLGLNKSDKKEGRSYAELVDLGFVEIEPLTYIRGRSLPQNYMIVDEAQNLTPHEVKTIASRVGEGTKLVLTGDATQIDNPYLDSSSNGLSYLVERLKGKDLVGHVTLAKSERSELATFTSGRTRPSTVVTDAAARYTQGDVVSVSFSSGHPRNDLRRNLSFVYAERRNDDGSWTVVATDRDPGRVPGDCEDVVLDLVVGVTHQDGSRAGTLAGARPTAFLAVSDPSVPTTMEVNMGQP